MTHQRINPPTLFDSAKFGFAQVVVSEGNRLIHCSGQVCWNESYEFAAEDDFAAQIRAALRNAGLALKAAGATPADAVRIVTYVVDYKEEYLPVIGVAMTEFFGTDNLPASTLLGVQCLSKPDFLVEVEVTAVV